MRKIYINEKYAELHNGSAIASQFNTDGYDTCFVRLEDVINILQDEANETAGTLMTGELNPSTDNELDRRYYIGRWDKLNELIQLLKANGN